MGKQKIILSVNKQAWLMRLLIVFCLTTQSLSIKINTTSLSPSASTSTSKLPSTLAALTTATNTTNATAKTAQTVAHKFQSINSSNITANITILHEVYETPDEMPIELNTHELRPLPLPLPQPLPQPQPQKPVKKKSYTPLEKLTHSINHNKPVATPPTPKELDLHPVTFDFNLGDLEDLARKVGDVDVDVDGKSVLLPLSSSEAKHLLSDAVDGDGNVDVAGVPYLESAHEENVSGGLDIEIALDDVTSSNSTANASTPMNDLTTSSVSTSSTGLPVVVTVSPHIFKIAKPNKSTKKERELVKHDDAQKRFGTNVNSLNGRVDLLEDAASAGALFNSTADFHQAANLFQIVTSLYDHFHWQASDIRAKVSTGCGLEMQAYLTALHENYEWAQRAYDCSGHYRGQMFYGNDKWLGEKNFCYEINRQMRPEERRHFEFKFFMGVIRIAVRIPVKMQLQLEIGECLPKSCTPSDVQAMFALDPHAQILLNLNYKDKTMSSKNASAALILVKNVRTVPGNFSFWRDLKFQIFSSFLVSLILLVLFATIYQAKLNRNKLTTKSIPTTISAKIDASSLQRGEDFQNNGKCFELYQMRTPSDNNNFSDAEIDVNSQKDDEQPHTVAKIDVEKAAAQTADYKLETCSNAGAHATYEAKKQLGLHEQLLLCFAFQNNVGVILNIDVNKETQTSCVHGLRVVAVLWTIMVHTYLQVFYIGENKFRRVIVERSLLYQLVGNATFSVDTFFFISGFLVTLIFLRNEKKYPESTGQFVRRSSIDTLLLFIYRYIRLTPAYLFVIFFNDFAMRHISHNSVMQQNVPATECSQYWWRNILYVNNFYPYSEICMMWSWYMANDMQFYLMASVILVLSTRYFKTAALIVCTFLFSSWGLSGVISLRYHYTHKVANPFESFDFLYDKPWQRVGTYIVGMLTGYLIYKVKTPPRITERVNSLLWLVSFGLLALIIFGVWQGELNELYTAFYVSIGHTAFGVGLVWIVVSCCWGLAPTWNSLLSYRGLWPLSRLTYCTYLIHPVIMRAVAFNMDGTVHLNNLFVLTIFFGNAVVSFISAFFISTLFEAPVIKMLKIFFRK